MRRARIRIIRKDNICKTWQCWLFGSLHYNTVMKTNTSNVKDKKEVLVLPIGVSWEGIIKAIKEEKGQEFLKTIDPATFKYILEESNHTKAIQSLLKLTR